MKKVIVLGSTGSIGKNTLKILGKQKDKFQVIGLSAFANVRVLEKQAKEFMPEYVSLVDSDRAKRFKKKIRASFKVLEGEQGLIELASKRCDILVLGITGLAALRPLLACLGKAKRLVLANKESIVAGADLVVDKMKASKTKIFPVDSEAWAVFRLLDNIPKDNVAKVYITASGGPFLYKNKNFIRNAGVKETLSHPVWNMGKRITVNSASLMNKGFEVIEVSHLFGLPVSDIRVLVHPQSAVHALVQTKEGSLFSAMFEPDMKIPISYGLNYPQVEQRKKTLDLAKQSVLNFRNPDLDKFPALSLAYRIGKKGGNLLTVLTIADEEAVSLFLREKIKFTDIYNIVSGVIKKTPYSKIRSVGDIFYWQDWAKNKVRKFKG